MKRIFQVEIKTAEEWGFPGPPDSLFAEIHNPRTGEVLTDILLEVDERWLAE